MGNAEKMLIWRRLLITAFVVGCIAIGVVLVERRLYGYVRVEFPSGVTLYGMGSGRFDTLQFYRMEVNFVDAANTAEDPRLLFLDLGGGPFLLGDVNPDLLVELGGRRNVNDPNEWLLSIKGVQGDCAGAVECGFEDGQMTYFMLVCDFQTSLGMVSFSRGGADGQRLVFPCNGRDAQAFFGEPIRSTSCRRG
jgi:hypothetical protein